MIKYYRLIDEGTNGVHGGHYTAEPLIRSADFGTVEHYTRTEWWDDAADCLTVVATDLEAGGTGFVVIAAGTIHRVIPHIETAPSTSLLHIVDTTADAIPADGLETISVLGTRATVDNVSYQERFEEHGVDVIVPEESRRNEVDQVVFEELIKGEIHEASRDRYLKAVDQLVERDADGVVLDCMGIELLIEQIDQPDVSLFDMTVLRAERTVK